MPIYKWNKLIGTIKGSRNIGKFYHASSLMFQIIPVNTVLFSIRNPGTYSFTIPTSQNYRTTVVGAGGSGTNQSTTIPGATGQSGLIEIRTI